MSEQGNPLETLSAALIERTSAAQGSVAAVRTGERHHVSGTLWQPRLVIASNQALPRSEEFEAVLPGGAIQAARLAGRDPGTNIALLRLDEPVSAPALKPVNAKAGAVVLAAGADAKGAIAARLGIVSQAGPEWHSSFGGRIDHYIALDVRLNRKEEGGPVFDAAGGFIGISTFGPHGRVLVIPAATIERVVPSLEKDGHVARGWLGIALQPVAIPESFRDEGDQASGLMAMSTVDGGPAARAGVVAGDIVLTFNGTPAHRHRSIASQLGPESIGQKANLRVIRGGTVISLETTITERPPG